MHWLARCRSLSPAILFCSPRHSCYSVLRPHFPVKAIIEWLANLCPPSLLGLLSGWISLALLSTLLFPVTQHIDSLSAEGPGHARQTLRPNGAWVCKDTAAGFFFFLRSLWWKCHQSHLIRPIGLRKRWCSGWCLMVLLTDVITDFMWRWEEETPTAGA